jgi:hypothetical protein
MDRQTLLWLCLALGLGACASSKSTLYDVPAIQSVDKWTIGFTYESRRTEEIAHTEAGAEALDMAELRRGSDSKFRDEIATALRDHHKIDVSQTKREGAGEILLQTSPGTHGFASVNVEIVLPSGNTAGSIQIKNGNRLATFKSQSEFAEYAANAIATAMRDKK